MMTSIQSDFEMLPSAPLAFVMLANNAGIPSFDKEMPITNEDCRGTGMDKPFPKTWGKYVEKKVEIITKKLHENHHYGVAASGIFDCTGFTPISTPEFILLPSVKQLPMTRYQIDWKIKVFDILQNNPLLEKIEFCKDHSKLQIEMNMKIDNLAQKVANNNKISFQEAREKVLNENLELHYVYEAMNKYFHLRNSACRIHNKEDDLQEGESITMGVSNFLDCLFTFYNSGQDIFRLRRGEDFEQRKSHRAALKFDGGVISTFIPDSSDADSIGQLQRTERWVEIGATEHKAKLGMDGKFDGNDHTKLILLAKEMLDELLMTHNTNIPILFIQTVGLSFRIMVLRYDFAEFLTCGLVWEGTLDLINFDGRKIAELLANLILFRNTLQMYGEIVYKKITKAKQNDRFGKNLVFVEPKTQMPDGKVAFPFETKTVKFRSLFRSYYPDDPLKLKCAIDGTLKEMDIHLIQLRYIAKHSAVTSVENETEARYTILKASRFAKQEAEILHRIQAHPNVVRLYSYGEVDPNHRLAKGFDYVIEIETVYEFIPTKWNLKNEFKYMLVGSFCLVKAIRLLHETFKIAHLDIRPENLGRNEEWEENPQIKLFDFDRSLQTDDVIDYLLGVSGYRAPELTLEVVSCMPIPVDVFAIGKVINTLIGDQFGLVRDPVFKPPLSWKSECEAAIQRSEIPSQILDLAKIAETMTTTDPKKRPNLSDIESKLENLLESYKSNPKPSTLNNNTKNQLHTENVSNFSSVESATAL